MTTIKIVRIYDKTTPQTGYRILVDRLWPRGISKEVAKLDFWSKETAPSTELRKWFGHDPAKFVEFAVKYRAELDQNPATTDLVNRVRTALSQANVVLLYAAKNTTDNEAVVLQQYLQEKIAK